MLYWLDEDDQEGWQEPDSPAESGKRIVQMGFPPIDEIAQVYTGLVKSMAHIPNGADDYELSRRLGKYLINQELRFVILAHSVTSLANIAKKLAATADISEKAHLTERLQSELQQARHAKRLDRSFQDERTWLVGQAMIASIALSFLSELDISITIEDSKS